MTSVATQGRRSRGALVAGAGVLLVIALALLSLTTGAAAISIDEIGAILATHLGIADAVLDPVNDAVIWSLRLPRTVVALLVGAALALAGVLMQGLFRNALASPGICGTSAGASFGAVLALSLGWADRSLLALPLLAVGGAFAALVLVTRLAQATGDRSIATLLLAGVAITAFLGAVNSWLLALSWDEFEAARRISYWLLGGISDRGWSHAAIIATGVAVGGTLALRLAPSLDPLLEGAEVAASLGVDVPRARRLALGGAALLTGCAVAVSGVVGFVGLVVPHAVRLVVGPGHRRLVPLAALSGAWFLLAADLLCRHLARPVELHLGIVTSFVGAPFFLLLLLRQRRGDASW